MAPVRAVAAVGHYHICTFITEFDDIILYFPDTFSFYRIFDDLSVHLVNKAMDIGIRMCGGEVCCRSNQQATQYFFEFAFHQYEYCGLFQIPVG